ncbi:EAL domain-containing protein [Sneathiella aquimaris]|uniref:EAL domain-containing protein n=1 Tax=Sneathiella aquimaris TaxID=2599305 RepID=UPI00146A6D6D|nr:EAL domain-containing protein [Sneathiella aquimaris]
MSLMSQAEEHKPAESAGMMAGDSDPVPTKPIVQTGPVEHHQIGEMAHFLKAFGRNKEEVVNTLMASSLQIVGLDDVKKEYEGKWEKIEHRVETAINAFFTKKLRKQDTFVQLAEGRFALIFANMTREEGQARALELSRELINLLFGQMPGVELISVEAMVLDVNLIGDLESFENLEEVIEYFQDAIAEASERETTQLKEVEEELTIQFRSVLNHPKQFISATEVVFALRKGDDTTVLSHSDPMLSGSTRTRTDLDLMALEKTGQAMREMGRKGNKPIVFLSICLETLANAYCRKNFQDMMNRLPDYTKQHLILNIEGIGRGIPNSRYRQILTSVTPNVLGFSLEVDKDWDCFHAISDLPVRAIVASSNEEEDIPWIQTLILQAKEKGIRSVWRNVETDEVARLAFRLGVDYVGGPAISNCQDSPIRPFSIKRP